MTTTDEALILLQYHDDFINMKRFEFSLAKLKERYPGEAPAHVIAQALMITEDDVERMYEEIVLKLRSIMGVE